MIVDIHAYFGSWPYWEVGVRTGEALVRLLDRYGIDKAAVCSLRAVLVDWRSGNEEVLRLCAEWPDRLVGIAAVGICSGMEAADVLAGYRDRGIRGLRLFPFYHGYPLEGDAVLDRVLERAAAFGWPVGIPARLSMNWMLPSIELSPVGKLAERFGEIRFVVGGINYSGARRAVGLMRTHENIWMETSCLQFFGAIQRLVEEVGADRILLGTGLPLQYPKCGLAKVVHAEIGAQERAAILGGNAARLLGIADR